jgi:hypothetical protein
MLNSNYELPRLTVVRCNLSSVPHINDIETARGKEIDGERRRAVCERAPTGAECAAATVAPLNNNAINKRRSNMQMQWVEYETKKTCLGMPPR